MDLKIFLAEFSVIVLVHFLAVASPGPDFAITVKQSLTRGRRAALITSLGIGSAILLHVTYSLIGIGLIIRNNPDVFTGLTWLAAAYLLYLGVQGLRSKPVTKDQQAMSKESEQTALQSFTTGFLVNGLNVKATLFFLSLFSVVISTTTPTYIQIIYGIYMAVATAAWFSFLSYVLTIESFRQKLLQKGYMIDRTMGVILILLAVNIVFNSF